MHFLEKTCNLIASMAPCCKLFTSEYVVQYRYSCIELDKGQLDMLITSQILAHQRIKNFCESYNELRPMGKQKKLSGEEFERYQANFWHNINKFFHCDIKVCENMFNFLHNVSETIIRNLNKHFNENLIQYYNYSKNILMFFILYIAFLLVTDNIFNMIRVYSMMTVVDIESFIKIKQC